MVDEVRGEGVAQHVRRKRLPGIALRRSPRSVPERLARHARRPVTNIASLFFAFNSAALASW
jgi:hypothetical protein